MRWLHGAWRLLSAIFLILLFCAFTKYELPCDKLLLEESRKIALNEVGTMETRSNRGEVAKYLNSVGLSEGHPYCAAGVYWCFAEAIDNLGLSKNEIPISRTAVANKMFNDAIRKGRKVLANVANNDLIVWKSKSGWNGHIERVVKVKRKAVVQTVGFNVKVGKGEGVGLKTRFLSHQLGKLMLRGIITFKEIER